MLRHVDSLASGLAHVSPVLSVCGLGVTSHHVCATRPVWWFQCLWLHVSSVRTPGAARVKFDSERSGTWSQRQSMDGPGASWSPSTGTARSPSETVVTMRSDTVHEPRLPEACPLLARVRPRGRGAPDWMDPDIKLTEEETADALTQLVMLEIASRQHLTILSDPGRRRPHVRVVRSIMGTVRAQ